MSDSEPVLVIDGRVARPLRLSFQALQGLDDALQVHDVSQFGAKRPGRAVQLSALLELAEAAPDATHLGLHGTRDDFHASIPLEPVANRGLVIYESEGAPLTVEAGGPFRFFVPDHAECQMDEIDECANVKYLDHMELTVGKGFDNRPKDEDEHARLHENED